jgi:large subunit ribosomal protein L7/L12
MKEYSPEITLLGDSIAALSLTKAVQLSDYLEEVHGIKVAETGYVPQPDPKDKSPVEKPPEQTEFTVLVTEYPADKKIAVIKEARTITSLGLKEAKALLEALPATIKEGISKDEAAKHKAVLESAGAKVVVK